jgi:hypothetical protein
MALEEVHVTIPKGGEGITVETKGFVGKACTDVTAELERRLGKVQTDTKKSEYYRQQSTRLQQKA